MSTNQHPTTGLMVRSPHGRYRPATRDEIIIAHAQATADQLPAGDCLESPAATRGYLIGAYRHLNYELFGMLLLDNRHRIIDRVELFRGTIDGVSVHPREVVKEALGRGAAAVILFHNHPSGVADPSQADELITIRLRDALALVDVRVLDHLIVGGDRCTSLAERGVL